MSQLPANSQLGSYQIIRLIGCGGMAQIYLAKTKGLAGFEKYLALKIINSDYVGEERFIQMLIDEAKITVSLNHTNIVQVFDLGKINNVYYIAMELVDGADVLELVNGLHAMGEAVPIEAAVFIGIQMCTGLHYAHIRKDHQGNPLNLVHRDISPQNILLSRAGEVKLADFGIAKAAGVSTKTQAGIIKGKIHYLAPEQALGQKIDQRTDIFGTGIVLWEMLTSRMAYAGTNVQDIADKVRWAKISPLSSIRPEVPLALEGIIMKALRRLPEERYATAQELQIELSKFMAHSYPDYSAAHLAQLVEKVLAKRGDSIFSQASVDLRPDIRKYASNGKRDDSHQEVEDLQNYPHLILESPSGEIIYTLGDELLIGRAGDFVIADPQVSRRHARIFKRGEEFIIEDLNSFNGTNINEQKIDKPQVLKHGDNIRVGASRLRFLLGRKLHSTPSSSPSIQGIPKLLIHCGEQSREEILEDRHELTYQVQAGLFSLSGTFGRIIRKEDGFWLESFSEREPIVFKGEVLSVPTRLLVGDTFQVGGYRFEYREEISVEKLP